MGTPWERMHCASLRSALRSPADTPPPPLSCGGTTRCRQALWADRNAGERGLSPEGRVELYAVPRDGVGEVRQAV